MHSVQRRDTVNGAIKRPDSATDRLSTFAEHETKWTERPLAPYEKCYHTSYQGDNIIDAVKQEGDRREGSSDGSDLDVEKGINGQKLWTHGLAEE